MALDFHGIGIKTLGVFDNQLPIPNLPKVESFEMVQRLFSSVVLITLVGFIESCVCGQCCVG
jgi:MFS superfamily sulfate permease-like transporter